MPFKQQTQLFHSAQSIDYSLYVITEDLADRSPLAIAEAAYAGGAGVVQLRRKTADSRDLFIWAQQLAHLARSVGKSLIINDRIDIALAVCADGVHLGPDDLPVSIARRLLGPESIIGASVSTVDEAIEAEAEGASYLGVGCIYGTTSKADAGEAIGPEIIREIKAMVNIPLVAIGGITPEHVGELFNAGADGIAVISTITRAKNMKNATRDLLKAIKSVRQQRSDLLA